MATLADMMVTQYCKWDKMSDQALLNFFFYSGRLQNASLRVELQPRGAPVFVAPDGTKLRSKPEVARWLGLGAGGAHRKKAPRTSDEPHEPRKRLGRPPKARVDDRPTTRAGREDFRRKQLEEQRAEADPPQSSEGSEEKAPRDDDDYVEEPQAAAAARPTTLS